jgi:hypothetical protein
MSRSTDRLTARREREQMSAVLQFGDHELRHVGAAERLVQR